MVELNDTAHAEQYTSQLTGSGLPTGNRGAVTSPPTDDDDDDDDDVISLPADVVWKQALKLLTRYVLKFK